MNISVAGRRIPKTPVFLKLRQIQPERFIEEIYRAPREHHTQKRFVPAAMNSSLQITSRWKLPRPRPKSGADSIALRSPSTLRLNRSNVKRKPLARGRTR